MKLITTGRQMGCIKLLINEVPSVLHDIVHMCSDKKKHKTASQLAKDYRLDMTLFPKLVEL